VLQHGGLEGELRGEAGEHLGRARYRARLEVDDRSGPLAPGLDPVRTGVKREGVAIAEGEGPGPERIGVDPCQAAAALLFPTKEIAGQALEVRPPFGVELRPAFG
jgi:hypothetical protein